MESKKFLNWSIPPGTEAVAEAFDRVVKEKWGGKGKWVGAAAAMLAYLRMSASERHRAGFEVVEARSEGTIGALVERAMRTSERAEAPLRMVAKPAPRRKVETKKRGDASG